ncbi:MAG TPA: hypothetical protein VFH18_01170 [Erysipelotrichaceae bacterium]|jgi:Flp pilus assembly protein TadB|nr:hypothetical protein [Erysipelotrichaceae bacterium]
MNILRALIVSVIGIFILMTLWPLFVFLVIVFGIYWFAISMRIKRMNQTVRDDFNQSSNQPDNKPKDVIDAQYTERSE